MSEESLISDPWQSQGPELSLDQLPFNLGRLGAGFLQPESKAKEGSPPTGVYNTCTMSESGHSFELDDTPGQERVRLQHRSGTFIEMDANGNETHKVYGSGFEITIKDKNVLIKGHCSVTIEGDAVINIQGNKTERIGGDYNLVVDGKYNLTARKGLSAISEDDVQISAGASLLPSLGGAVRITSNEEMYVTGDVMVSGTLNAEMLYSKTTVDADVGMTAGPLGFVTPLGGVSAGLPLALPGTVNASVSVNAPLGAFGVMTSVWMTDIINTGLSKINSAKFNSHKHPIFFDGNGVPLPVTGPPLPLATPWIPML